MLLFHHQRCRIFTPILLQQFQVLLNCQRQNSFSRIRFFRVDFAPQRPNCKQVKSAFFCRLRCFSGLIFEELFWLLARAKCWVMCLTEWLGLEGQVKLFLRDNHMLSLRLVLPRRSLKLRQLFLHHPTSTKISLRHIFRLNQNAINRGRKPLSYRRTRNWTFTGR